MFLVAKAMLSVNARSPKMRLELRPTGKVERTKWFWVAEFEQAVQFK